MPSNKYRFPLPAWICMLLVALPFIPTHTLAQSSDFFRTEGPEIVDPSGTPVVLRGVGLGGWLVPEGYMLHIAAPDGGSPRTIRSQIEDLIGVADTDRFFELYRANYVKEKDIAAIAEWGFDHIRLPFHYKDFFDPLTETFDENGFQLLDTFLGWCRTYGLYVILDMHAAPGAQNALNISDSDGEARLWTEPDPYQTQTITIWTEIARRYASETLIIGYDLINEPVTPDGVTTEDLFDFYKQLAEAVRQVDTNHILFIEGNYFATTFLAPADLTPFDDNMVYTFHKYWNGTALNSIQYLLDIRTQTNVPLWLGETGENSNTWFHQVTRLMDTYGIGVNWWTHKKIETTTSPLSAPFVPGYEAVLDYWRNSGPRPTAEAARTALFAMAEGLDMDSCEVRRDVLASLFNPDYATMRAPFRDHVIPGIINAVDYDLGNQGVTYSDNDFMATSGTPGGGNIGGKYRNDGVDIEASSDPQGFGYNVGWTDRVEWLTYSANVQTTGRYDIEVRVASAVGGGSFTVFMDNNVLASDVPVPNTGGWQNWISVWLRDVPLDSGEHILKLVVRREGFNVNRMRFVLLSATAVEEPVDADNGARLKGFYPNPFNRDVRITFESDKPVRARVELFDVLGRSVYNQLWKAFSAGAHSLDIHPGLVSGPYFFRLDLDDGKRLQSFTRPVIVTDGP